METESDQKFIDHLQNKYNVAILMQKKKSEIQRYLEMSNDEIKALPREGLSSMAYAVSRYTLWLRGEIGRAKAVRSAAETQLKRRVFPIASEFKATSLDERKFLAIESDTKCRDLQDEIVKQNMVIEQLDPVIWGLDNLGEKLMYMIKYRSENAE